MAAKGQWKPEESKVMALDELEKLLRVTEGLARADIAAGRKMGPTRWAVVDLAVMAGLRVSEIAALKVSDVRTEGRKPCIVVRSGKGGKRRTIPIIGPLKKLKVDLSEYMLWRTAGQPIEPDAPFLMSTWLGSEKHYTPTALKLQFKRALALAGIDPKRYSIHCGRHSAATYLYARTKNLRLVQRILGHSTPAITAHYAAIVNDWEAMNEAGDEPLYGGKQG